jgi:hypothetical protein
MALVLKDRVKETSAVVGTGTATLLGAETGYQSFSVIGNGNTCYYTIQNTDSGFEGEWEAGIGTYSTGATGATQAAGPTTGSWVTNGSLVGSNVTWYSASDTGYTAGDYVLLFDQTAGSSFFYYGQITLIQFAGGFGYAFHADLISDGGTPNGDPSSSWLMQESTGTTLNRTAVLSSSNSGSLVTFSAGTKTVFVTYPAEKAVALNTTTTGLNVGEIPFTDADGYIDADDAFQYSPTLNQAKAPVFYSINGISVYSTVISYNYTLPENTFAVSYSPLATANGVSVTVPSGQSWTIAVNPYA